MAIKDRSITKKVNIYDGQRVTESDLDAQQVHQDAVISNLALDFHGSGVIKESPFEEKILLDTRHPGLYAVNDNPSKLDLESGSYDGLAISLDCQPSDTLRGNRIEFELIDSQTSGRIKTKILVLGRAFNGLDSQGELVAEVIEFPKNCKKISKHYYLKIISILFNHFSGGTGKTEVLASVESQNLISEDSGYLIIRESDPLSVYPYTRMASQTESPNYDLNHFITSTVNRSISDEIELGLGSLGTISDLYIQLESREQLLFEKNGATSISYGQKFLAKTNNIQKIDLLLSVIRDEERDTGEQFDFSGDLVVSIHELASDVSCPTDAVPDDLIDFDPELTPIIEISYGQEDLAVLGYKLTDEPQIVSFNFSGTLLADPNIEPSITPNKYYAVIISRRGDNRTGTVGLEKGYDKAFKKGDDGLELTILEQFEKQHSKYIEYDPTTKRFLNDSESSLWYIVHSDAVEIVNGTAYSDTGKAITVPKTIEYIGDTEISNFERNISLRTVAEDANNFIVLSQVEKFTDPGTHPRTGNFVFTRYHDAAKITIVNDTELEDLTEDTYPFLLARIKDKNVREAQTLTGTFDKPGLINQNYIYLVNPGNSLLTSNLVNRILVPDTNCDCNSKYRIVSVECSNLKIGDLNDDGEITSPDLSALLDLVGNTINSSVTEKSILGGSLSILDFIKSDVNDDGTIDGLDIELLEDAVDGYINFEVSEEIKVLTLKLENVLEEDDYPTIFVDTEASGSATAGGNTITFETATDNQALAFRIGDQAVIPALATDAGTYLIATKDVVADGITVTITVTNTDDSEVEFVGSSDFNISIISGTAVNLFADNLNLLNIPFEDFTYEITFIEAPFEDTFVEVCDLRRFIGTSFIEEATSTCEVQETECLPTTSCEPVYKNQTYIPGDIYLPNGNILSEPGVPHHGDFEYTNIKIPLPAGNISDCSLNIYNTFIKSEDGGALTTAGYTAMKYSDGTVVGCEDLGANTDLTKGRVKISHAVCSIFVDALVDGYSTDEEEETVDSETDLEEGISEEFEDNTYTSFDTWIENALNSSSIIEISHPSGSNEAAIFDVTTTADSSLKFGRLDLPTADQEFTGDFIIDFKATRTTWPESSLVTGKVSSFMTLVVTNDDTSTSTLKLGWKVIGGYETKIFYSGSITDSDQTVISTFEYETEALDAIGDEVLFRLRRTNDVISAYYIIPDRLSETTIDSFGQYIRIGENPDVQPGDGSVELSYELTQENSPTPGKSFFVRLSEVIIRSDYESDHDVDSLTIGRTESTGVINHATLTFPINLTRRTSIVSATLSIPLESTGTVLDTFHVIPMALLNSDNLGSIFNVPLETNSSVIASFIPGSLVSGGTLDVDLTLPVVYMLSRVGHLPGFIKGFVIEPDAEADSSFTIGSGATLNIEYEDESTGIVFKVGVSVDPLTGIATFNTKNILYDALVEESRTIINFGVYLKKAGFKNSDLEIGVNDLSRLGIGSCSEVEESDDEELCSFIVGYAGAGTFVRRTIFL